MPQARGKSRGGIVNDQPGRDAATFAALARFRRLMSRLLVLMLALVGLGMAGLRRGSPGWAIHAVFALAALAALAMLLAPLAMAWIVRKR
jgi:hypothetical protein